MYISTMESKLYPFTATQWHPEKNAFEWGDKLHIPHSRGAVEVTHAGETWRLTCHESLQIIFDSIHHQRGDRLSTRVVALPQASVLEGNDQGELCACFAVSSFFVEQARSSFHKARDVLEEDEVILLHACCT